MSNSNITKYLEQLKAEGKYDSEFIDVLIAACTNDDDWLTTANELSQIIDRRYVKNKNNKT